MRDAPDHRIAIDFQNGKAWASEGFDNAILITMGVTAVGVPAPAGLALIALGLSAIGLRARRARRT